MRSYVSRSNSGGVYQVLGTLNAHFVYEKAKDRVDSILFWLTLSYFFSPIVFIILFVFTLYRYDREIKIVFLANKSMQGKYKSMFAPLVDKTLFSAVGHRVYPEELEEHLSIINSNQPEDMRKLAEKGKKMRKNMNRQFGFNIDKLTRHIFFLGTTGSGKTFTILSFFTDVLKAYCGFGMLDGKSDQEMEYKIYNLCKEHYFETQFNAIILNKAELGTESNSYSPLLSYTSAMKASEFLGEFLKGGDGNADYFANRGKVMLANLVMHYKNRQRFYGENFSLGDLSSATNQKEMNDIYYSSYCVAFSIEKLIEEKINSNKKFKIIMNKAKSIKSAQSDTFENMEVLNEFINQNSFMTKEVERVLGVSYPFIKDYYNLITLLTEYIGGISPSWRKHVTSVAEGLYLYYTDSGRNFLYNCDSPVSAKEIRIMYEKKLKNATSDEYKTIVKLMEQNNNRGKVELLATALDHKGDTESAEKMAAAESQQHSYSQQQWGRLFGLFNVFAHIMGTPFPDVDGEDLVKNNKVLFVMLPVLELSEDQVQNLGKMFILMFKNIASIALGGEKQSATPVQFKIYQNKIKPNPLFLMVFDEIGAYISGNGLSFLLSQVRSLRIGIILSGQESVSIQPEGNAGSREQSRILGNVGKILLSSRDGDTKKFEDMVPEVEVIESDGFMHSAVSKRVWASQNLAVKKIKTFEASIASRFAKGFGVYIDGGRDEPAYFQSYYLGDNADFPLQIRKYQSVENLMR